MPAHKIPQEIKAMRGTLRPYLEKKNNSPTVSDYKPLVLTKKTVPCPASITDDYCRKYWKQLTKGLLAVGVLSGADLPQVEQCVLTLQKLREVQQKWLNTSVYADDFDDIDKQYERLVNRFDRLSSKYYVSPTARAKIRLDDLTIKEKQLDVKKKEDSAISNLLDCRQEIS